MRDITCSEAMRSIARQGSPDGLPVYVLQHVERCTDCQNALAEERVVRKALGKLSWPEPAHLPSVLKDTVAGAGASSEGPVAVDDGSAVVEMAGSARGGRAPSKQDRMVSSGGGSIPGERRSVGRFVELLAAAAVVGLVLVLLGSADQLRIGGPLSDGQSAAIATTQASPSPTMATAPTGPGAQGEIDATGEAIADGPVPVGHVGGGGLAALTATESGLIVSADGRLNLVQTDSHPRVVARSEYLTGTVSSMASQGEWAYAIIRNRDIWDGDPHATLGVYRLGSEVKRLRSVTLGGMPIRVVAHGNRLFVTDQIHGLRTLDVQDPERPVETGSAELRGDPVTMTVVGDALYVLVAKNYRGGTENGETGVHVFDTEEDEDRETAFIMLEPNSADQPEGATEPSIRPRALLGGGDRAYIVADDAVYALDPGLATAEPAISFAPPEAPSWPWAAVILSDYLVLPTFGPNEPEFEILVYRISDGEAERVSSDQGSAQLWDLAVIGEAVYAAGTSGNLYRVTPATGAIESFKLFSEALAVDRHWGQALSVTDRGLVLNLENGYALYDITSPDAPREIARNQLPAIEDEQSNTEHAPLGWVGDFLVASSSLGLAVIDESDDNRIVSQVETRGYPVQALLVGNLALVIERTDPRAGALSNEYPPPATPTPEPNIGGLRLIDLSDPTRPTETAFVPGEMQAVAVDGRFAYIVEQCPDPPAEPWMNNQCLTVLDLDQAPPARLGIPIELPPQVAAGHVVARAGLAAVDDTHAGDVYLFDISEPTDPKSLETIVITEGGSIMDVAVTPDRLYVLAVDGLHAIRRDTPDRSHVRLPHVWASGGMAVIQDTVYVAGEDGMRVYLLP